MGLTKQYPSQYKPMNQSRNLPEKVSLVYSFSKGKNSEKSREEVEKEEGEKYMFK